MHRSSFNAGWTVARKSNPFAEMMGDDTSANPAREVTLPHDWLISQPRAASAASGASVGYYPDDIVVYRKTFSAPTGYRTGRVDIEFDGVYRDAMIYVNNSFVGQRPSGYTPFALRVDRHLVDGDNEIRVECRKHLDARWYSGMGIYRDTWLTVGGPLHIAPHGARIQTVSADETSAVIDVITRIDNEVTWLETVRLATELVGPRGQVVASDVAQVSLRPSESPLVRQRFVVPEPSRWSTDTPTLYTCRSTLLGLDTSEELDRLETRFGIRTLEWDAVHGLRLNGLTTKLRGGAVHHDNGVIGAATVGRAEERRVELLKRAGYNAIRSAHNPISTAMLEACDRIGMLVMDEAFDAWMLSKVDFDYSLSLPRWWRDDLTAMVERDFNHPSVILYSVGNEIADTGNRWDATLGRDMVDCIKALDPTRPVTNAINPTLSANHESSLDLSQLSDPSMGINTFMNAMLAHMQGILASESMTRQIDEPLSQLDIAGYNYAPVRYEVDIVNHPQRLLLGTETTSKALTEVWPLVERHPQVIGDFAWTAWDYIGEAGIGRSDTTIAGAGLFATYPWRTSMTGEIDITGHRRTISYWREVVWGLRRAPYIAVYRPETYPNVGHGGTWSWSDTLGSWSWEGFEGAVTAVEVYSNGEEVELILDGTVLGRRRCGQSDGFVATFEVVYQPGELTAVAYTAGLETGRHTIRTADDDVQLSVTADRNSIRADDTDLAFVEVRMTDSGGTTHVLAQRRLTVTVAGAGMLLGLGSGDPASENNYSDSCCDLFDGRALAVVRPTGAGEILVRVTTDHGEATDLTIAAVRTGHRPDKKSIKEQSQYRAPAMVSAEKGN